jgi:hypothetical protein
VSPNRPQVLNGKSKAVDSCCITSRRVTASTMLGSRLSPEVLQLHGCQNHQSRVVSPLEGSRR